LEQTGEGWLRGVLEKQRELALSLHAQVLGMDAEIETHAAAPATPPPHGLGELTALTLQVEVMDWHRLQNRKAAGSFIGCCPSEYSTGPGGQVLGNIDR